MPERKEDAARQHFLGLASLNLVTVIWGSQHAMIKDIVTHSSVPSLLNAIRFCLGSAAMLAAWICCNRKATSVIDLVRAGFELSLWQVLGFTLQLVGLQWTTASRSAFLLYLNAPLVPFFAKLLGERLLGLRSYGAAALAVVGTLLLTYDGASPNIGDLVSVGAAAASAMFIVRLGRHSARYDDAAGLSAITLAWTAVWCAALAAINVVVDPTGHADLGRDVAMLLGSSDGAPAHMLQLVYLSVVVTALASWMQAWGQARVKPHEAVIIYTMDPIYGAFFAWLMLGERLHLLGYIGMSLVLCANILRQAPWEAWQMTKDLVTPMPGASTLSMLGIGPRVEGVGKKAANPFDALDTKRVPLLPA